MARRIAQPLTDLSAAMGRVREGDFEITAAPSTRTNNEIGDLARSFDEMTLGLKERERLRGTLGRYVSGDVAERILSETDDLSLRGEVRHVAVLFLDVRGFTTISEKLTPTEVVALLNEYFGVVVDRVGAHGGTVNKFIGDAVNLAQRLESQARAGEVLVSQPVYDKVALEVDAAPRDPVKLKGKSKPVPLWEIRRTKVVATEAA